MKKSLKDWNKILQECAKDLSRRDFIMQVCSWQPFNFYKTQEGVSKYPETELRPISLVSVKEYTKDYPWWIEYNKEVSSEPFFHQLKAFFQNTPHATLQTHGWWIENSDWSDAIYDWAKNVYLSVSTWDDAENVLYSFKIESWVRNIISSINVTRNCESIFDSKTVRNSQFIFYSQYIYDSSQIRFSSNLIGCSYCFGCNNLQNQSYCINNIQLSKEEYSIHSKKLLSRKELYEEYKDRFLEPWGKKLSVESTWDGLYHCSNVHQWFEVSHMKDCTKLLYTDGWSNSSECHSCLDVAVDNSHNLYGVCSNAFGEHIYHSIYLTNCQSIYYSYFMQQCSYCLWCIGLKNKQFCIFNKQYTKEERHQKVNDIFTKMKMSWELWKTLPWSINPFYFNDTAAYLIDDSFTKEEVEAAGYLRRDEEIKVDIPEWMDVVEVKDLWEYEWFDSEWNWIIDSSILKKVICDEDWNSYRVIKMEYDFLVKHGLPLPRQHRLKRLKWHFKINNQGVL